MSDELASQSRRALMLAALAGAVMPALGVHAAPCEASPSKQPTVDETADGRVVLSGRVLASDGTPVRGARLELAHERSRLFTDDDGRFLWAGAMPRQGILQCSLGDPLTKQSCRLSADLWMARSEGEPYQLHASHDQASTWRVSLGLPQAA